MKISHKVQFESSPKTQDFTDTVVESDKKLASRETRLERLSTAGILSVKGFKYSALIGTGTLESPIADYTKPAADLEDPHIVTAPPEAE